MKATNHILKKPGKINFISAIAGMSGFLLAAFIILPFTLRAQTYVNAPMSGTYTSGEYVNGSSITIVPNTIISPAAGQSVYIHTTFNSCAPLALNISANKNYVLTSTPRKPGYDPAATGYSTCDVMQAIQYLDGLGRPVQAVQVKGSPDATKDVVQPMAYDQFGREPVKYLPYTSAINDGSYKPNALNGEQAGFYNSPPAGVTVIPSPYSQTIFDGSPLNRTVEQGAPGNAWQPGNHAMHMDYLTNNSIVWANDQTNSRQAVIYTAVTNADLSRTLVNGGTYSDNTLTITVSKDENWAGGRGNTTEEYKDYEGRVILKRTYNNSGGTLQKLSTYYVYDDTGNLTFVLPPGAAADDATPNQTTLNTLCYQYQYDELNRMVAKHLPGKDWDETTYNNMDQVVYTQDGNQRQRQERSFIKYDGLGRVIMTGIETGHTLNRADLQTVVNGQTSYYFEVRDPNGYYGYTVNAPPGNLPNMHPLAVNYYDNYSGILNLPGYAVSAGASITTTGLQTAGQTMMLNPDGTYGPALWNINYYDEKGRNIATYAQHYLNANANQSNYDLVTTTYDNITNEVTATNRNHYTTAGSSPAVTIANTYAYDHMGRKTQTTEQINGGAATTISQTDYNDVGQLTAKHIGNNMQTISYAYNERGWLKNATAPLFAMQLNYNDGTTPQYNGNIANLLYSGQNSGSKTFNYSYDNLNRLTIAQSTNGVLDEQISYDVMGNITQLTRGGTGNGTLNYTGYTGNQLNTVTGYSPRSYAYDANGNATSDGISKGISYNFLNLPRSVSSVATYTYDANGTKIRNTGSDGSWDYISGIVYHNNVIEFIQTEEGRAIPANGYTYQYNLKDHLGNNRVSFYKNPNSGNLEVIQENEYYPFGLSKTLVQNGNKYLYNGKEKQTDLTDQYDYGARFYDPVVGRFGTIDRYAEKYHNTNPYHYALNNPTNNIDINGDSVFVAKEFRENMNSALKSVYGDNASKFGYNNTGMLTYSGDTKGFTKEQTALYKGLSGIMSETTTTNMIFGESTTITMKDGTTGTVKAADGGGAVTVLVGENNVSQNTILIDPKTADKSMSVFAITDAYYKKPIDPANGARFEQKTIPANLGTSTFHELGHVIYRGQTQNNVLDYENKARKQMGLPKRPYDETHNSTVKKGQYGN